MANSVDDFYDAVDIAKSKGLIVGGSRAHAAKLRTAQGHAMRAYEAPLKRGRFFGDDKAGSIADRSGNAADYLERRSEGRRAIKGFRGKRSGSYK